MTSQPDPAAVARVTDAATVRRGTWQGIDQANIMSLELISAILVWAGIGWLVDRWLGTAPWFVAIGALVGNAAGIYLVWLRSSRMEGVAAPTATSAAPGADPVGGPAGAR
jgi:F0F1-type ATP synthase assembly protein I